ncbi:hypothetical protein MMC32_004127 [Xylographa parallela]|nr:hypothetical protein [Xylographa parallela]
MSAQPTLSHSFTRTYHRAPYQALSPTHSALSASDKTIVITAGHTGIGFSISNNFAAAGASHIVLIGRRADVLATARTALSAAHPATTFHAFAGSVTDAARVAEIFARVRADVAEPDVLVTSAAFFARPSEVVALEAEQVRESFETNVLANLGLVRAFLDSPRAQGEEDAAGAKKREKVVLDVSTAAVHFEVPATGTYAASKLAFTRLMAAVQADALATPDPRYELRVHSFHPGVVLTQAAKDFGAERLKAKWDDVELSGRFAVWLAGGEAGFLRGRFVWANWDVEELVERKEEIERDGLLKVGVVGRAEWEVEGGGWGEAVVS